MGFASCAEARAAGAAPLYEGDAGYLAEWDRDGDGVACETSGDEKRPVPAASGSAAETQDSGMYGILVPGTATNRNQLSSNSVSFDLPGMDLDEAAKWMGSHLPVDAEVNGMRPCDAQRFDDLHQWFWAGEVTASGVDMFSVSVLNTTPASVLIKYSPTDPGGC
ncbi:excalibur calcium-binding domain-containing protein [Rhodococcus qingshengii]